MSNDNNTMNVEKKFKENLQDIDSIIKSIVETDNRSVRSLKYRDLKDKIKKNKYFLGNEVKRKRKFDVVIFTIVPIEFTYANKILKFMKPNDPPNFKVAGLGYHEFKIHRNNNLAPLNVAITLVGTAGDITCSLACTKFFSAYDSDLAILCGIAAGVKGVSPIYSTIIGKTIVNYEFQRITKDSIEYRPQVFNINKLINNNITNIIKVKDSVVKQIKKNIKTNLEKGHTFNLNLLNSIDVKDGLIASGAKLLADGKTLRTLREEIKIEKGIVAAEMEGSGFAPACEIEDNKKWMVFRGISDYGENDKNKQSNKKYQKVAVISAVTTMLNYLTNHYETPSESGYPEVKDLKF